MFTDWKCLKRVVRSKKWNHPRICLLQGMRRQRKERKIISYGMGHFEQGIIRKKNKERRLCFQGWRRNIQEMFLCQFLEPWAIGGGHLDAKGRRLSVILGKEARQVSWDDKQLLQSNDVTSSSDMVSWGSLSNRNLSCAWLPLMMWNSLCATESHFTQCLPSNSEIHLCFNPLAWLTLGWPWYAYIISVSYLTHETERVVSSSHCPGNYFLKTIHLKKLSSLGVSVVFSSINYHFLISLKDFWLICHPSKSFPILRFYQLSADPSPHSI